MAFFSQQSFLDLVNLDVLDSLKSCKLAATQNEQWKMQILNSQSVNIQSFTIKQLLHWSHMKSNVLGELGECLSCQVFRGSSRSMITIQAAVAPRLHDTSYTAALAI